jgi:hypothetical protein
MAEFKMYSISIHACAPLGDRCGRIAHFGIFMLSECKDQVQMHNYMTSARQNLRMNSWLQDDIHIHPFNAQTA